MEKLDLSRCVKPQLSVQLRNFEARSLKVALIFPLLAAGPAGLFVFRLHTI